MNKLKLKPEIIQVILDHKNFITDNSEQAFVVVDPVRCVLACMSALMQDGVCVEGHEIILRMEDVLGFIKAEEASDTESSKPTPVSVKGRRGV